MSRFRSLPAGCAVGRGIDAHETPLRALGPDGLSLAQAIAVLGDGCELRHAVAIADVAMAAATRLAEGLVRVKVLAADDPPRFIHPVVHDALEASLGSGDRARAHRCAARLLHADGAPYTASGDIQPGNGELLIRLDPAHRAPAPCQNSFTAADLAFRAR